MPASADPGSRGRSTGLPLSGTSWTDGAALPRTSFVAGACADVYAPSGTWNASRIAVITRQDSSMFVLMGKAWGMAVDQCMHNCMYKAANGGSDTTL